ncbi:MAG: YopX family protein [Candidatus Nanoarchaeia archaeon]|nr:YopX family protein [Candidatus Nanoarchaeia archaeon]
MREIKFRAWDITKSKSYFMDMDELLSMSMDSVFNSNLILEQYIGLKDKNGKEIYEGDIIQRENKLGHIGVIQFTQGVFGANWDYNKNNDPEWTDGMLYGGWGANHNLRSLDDGILEQFQVIGNIHENKELLNV